MVYNTIVKYQLNLYFKGVLSMENRLKIMRTVTSRTQKQVAEHMNISQNTYSYWESGKVNISSEDMQKLAVYFGVNIDFLSGRRYRMQKPPQKWYKDLYEDYLKSKREERVYMEYLYGSIVYVDDMNSSNYVENSPIEKEISLTEQEKTLLEIFRSTTEKGRMRMIQSVLNIHDQMEGRPSDIDSPSAGNIAADVAEEAKDFIASQQITSTKRN